MTTHYPQDPLSPMSLDGAILHAEEQAQQHAGTPCGAEHEQLAKWLKELQGWRRRFFPTVGFGDVVEALAGHEALLADGFEEALVGYAQRFSTVFALYDRQRCIDILVERDGMAHDEAEEFFEFNVVGAWVGEGTPAFATFFEVGERVGGLQKGDGE